MNPEWNVEEKWSVAELKNYAVVELASLQEKLDEIEYILEDKRDWDEDTTYPDPELLELDRKNYIKMITQLTKAYRSFNNDLQNRKDEGA